MLTLSLLVLTVGHCVCKLDQSMCLRLQSTVLREVWGKLYKLASDANGNTDYVSALNRRILTSLKPEQELAFVLDLTDPGKSAVQHA